MRWLLQNVRQRATYALHHPRYVADSILRELTLADERFLAHITGIPTWRVRSFLDEPISTPAFAEALHRGEKRFRALSLESADLFAKKVLTQYAAVRALAPACVVETGVANGVSSAYLLLALHKNGQGRLHSIGLEDPTFLPPGAAPGWLVPTWLRGSWRIHLGDAREILGSLLSQLGSVDMFIHDSLHTYEHMSWEFQNAYPALRSGGLLVADDALWNDSFYDFARKMREPDAKILRGVGFLRKRSA